MGSNGYERVSDAQLNAFSDYVVQNMEQADKTITISLVTALLIVIIIILLVCDEKSTQPIFQECHACAFDANGGHRLHGARVISVFAPTAV